MVLGCMTLANGPAGVGTPAVIPHSAYPSRSTAAHCSASATAGSTGGGNGTGAGALVGGGPSRCIKSRFDMSTARRPGSMVETISSGTRDPRGKRTWPIVSEVAANPVAAGAGGDGLRRGLLGRMPRCAKFIGRLPREYGGMLQAVFAPSGEFRPVAQNPAIAPRQPVDSWRRDHLRKHRGEGPSLWKMEEVAAR